MKRVLLAALAALLTACSDDSPTTIDQCHWRYTKFTLTVTADTVAVLTPFDSVLVCAESPVLKAS